MRLFGKTPLIGEDLNDWIIDNFDWVESERPAWWAMAELIRPTREYFHAPGGHDHETALLVFEDMKRQLGTTQPVALEPLPDLPDELLHDYTRMSDTAGQYWDDAETPLIIYNPKLMRRPVMFINTLAHELIHARLAPVVDDLPGGAPAHELATDLHAIIAGYGVIQLEAAEQAGWAGYMSQASRAVALAEFLHRKAIAPDDAFPYLSRRPASWLRKALASRKRVR